MSDQIDPEDLYKAAYRETQGQPVDAVGRKVDFGPDADWDAAAHVRFLRQQCGASSGYTADLIQNLHCQLTAFRAECEGLREAKPGDTIEIKNTFFDCAGQNTPLTYETDGSAHLKMDGWFCFAEDPRAAPSPSPAPGVVEAQPKIAVLPNGTGVCFGGRWNGWQFRKHPDGNWISEMPLEMVDPMEGSSLASLASLSQPAKGREGERP